MILLDPITARDFSRGRISKSAVTPFLTPVNSIANSTNVDFSEIIGSGIVRKGTGTMSNIEYTYTTGQNNVSVVLTDEAAFGGTDDWQAQLFTPIDGQNTTLAISLKLYRVGAAVGNITFSLQTVSGTSPTGTVVNGNTVTMSGANITTGTSGALYTFLLNPGTFLSTGTKYAIVMKYLSGSIGGGQYIMWMRDSAASVTGAQIRTTANAGSSWSDQSGDFYFVQIVRNLSTTYDRAPMGNFSFIINNLPKNVVAFREEFTGSVVVYYWNPSAGWRLSDLISLSYLSRCRFAALNGYVFEANGAQTMRSSADFGQTWGTTNCITTDSVQPSLLIVSKNRLIASGYSAYPSRVYFSTIVDPSSSPFITWDTAPASGDWIDINPDDGGRVTGFALTSNQTLVFKNQAMYRLNTITKTVDSENIFNVGAVSQEAITTCLGITYFYSGNGIYQTDGTFPQQISRLGVQDYIDRITSAFGENLPTEVYAWNDGFNVYFSIGNITMDFGPNDSRTIPYVVLKFSVRDQSWQVLSYPFRPGPTSIFGIVNNSDGIRIVAQTYNGKMMNMLYSTTSDDGAAIPYSLETQELEFGNRSHTKQISDRIVIFTQNGQNGSFSVKENDRDYKSADIPANDRITVGFEDVNFEAEFFTFRWQGEAKGSRPIFEGYHLPKITDLGIMK